MRIYRVIPVVGFCFLNACNYTISKINSDDRPIQDLADNQQTVGFDIIKPKVLERYCISCHAQFSDFEKTRSYIVPGQPDSSPLFVNLRNNGGGMPKGGGALSGAELTVLRRWIREGALEKSETAAPLPPPQIPPPPPIPAGAELNFALIKTQIFDYRCASCHREFNSYASVLNYLIPGEPALSAIYIRLKNNGGDMPKSGQPLSEDELDLVRRWIEKGAQ